MPLNPLVRATNVRISRVRERDREWKGKREKSQNEIETWKTKKLRKTEKKSEKQNKTKGKQIEQQENIVRATL